MKEVLIVANSSYKNSLAELPEADRALAELNRLFLSPLYGNARASVRQNITAKQIIKTISNATSENNGTSHLVLYLVGHGVRIENSETAKKPVAGFAGIGSPDKPPEEDLLTWPSLMEALQALSLQDVSVILDCCHSEMAAELVTSLPQSNTNIELLAVNGPDGQTFTDNGITWLTKQFITSILSGSSKVAQSNFCTLESINQSIARSAKRKPHRVKLTPVYQTTSRSRLPPALIGCPDTLPKELRPSFAQLLSYNQEEASEALQTIEKYAHANTDPRLTVTILETLHDTADRLRFQKPRTSQNIDKRVASITTIRERLEDVAHTFEATELTLYTAAASPWANICGNAKQDTILLDTYAESPKPESLAKSVRILVFEPRNLEAIKLRNFCSELLHMGRDIPEFSITIINCSSSDHLENRLGYLFRQLETQGTEATIVWEDAPPLKANTLILDEDIFQRLFQKHSRRLATASGNSDYKKLYRRTSKQCIEPKFILVRRSGKIELAILDSEDTIKRAGLQKTTEPNADFQILSEAEVKELGFKSKKSVHPIFQDPCNLIHRIYIDAKIFSLYLTMPNLLVKIPTYAYQREPKKPKELPLSTFVRTIEQAHPRGKVHFANISKKRRHLKVFQDLISEHPCYSRFAPTPSGSLHLGNLRTAVISYLASIPNSDTGHFEIRFDDTNSDPNTAKKHKESILRDLSWIGIGSSDTFSQSDQDRQELYAATFDLLHAAGFIQKNGEEVNLNVDSLDRAVASVTDVVLGCKVSHNLESTPKRNARLSYSLRWAETGLYQYKLAGIVDDLLHSSIVVRDIRQLDSHFSFKQSVIAEAIRQAYHLAKARGLDRLCERFDSIVGAKRPKRSQPLPLFCPPLYLHVSPVVDEDNKPLAKRLGNAGDDCQTVRENGKYFSETWLIWILGTLPNSFLTRIGMDRKKDMIRIVAGIGSAAFLSNLRGHVNLMDLSAPSKPIRFHMSDLRKIDSKVLQSCEPQTIFNLLSSLKVAKEIRPSIIRKFSAAVWTERKEFGGAEEICSFFVHLASLGVFDNSTQGGFRSVEPMQTQASEANFRKYRLDVTGKADGPCVFALHRILSSFVVLGGKRLEATHSVS